MKFNLGEHVRVKQDKNTDYFTGCEGIVRYVGRNSKGESLYGIEITLLNRTIDILDLDTIYSFEEDELESIIDINCLIQFM